MKIKINNSYKDKVKLFKSNIFLKKSLNEDLKQIYSYNQITVYNALKKITGVNSSRAFNFIMKAGISPKTLLKDIKKNFSLLNNSFELNLVLNKFKLNQNILSERRQNIHKKVGIMNLTGIRHKNNLPVRGQRTSTNAQTRKKYRII